jgi:hypothetical protein
MDEFDRSLDEVGRRVSPNLQAARQATLDRGAAAGGRVSVRNRLATVLVGTACAAALATVLAVSITHRTGSSTSTQNGLPSAPSGVSAGAGGAVVSSHSVSEGTATAQGTATLPSASPGAISSSQAPATIQSPKSVNESNDGATVVLHVGEQLDVNLSGGVLHWSEPTSSNSKVLARMSGQTSGDGSASAVFRAMSAGQAMVFSAGNPACASHCGVPSRAYQVTVTVVA